MTKTAFRWTSLASLVLCVAELTCSPTWASDPADRPPQRTVKTPSPTMSDVEYGKQESQVLDFWKADADKPTPVMIYFHGGGFKKGSKKQISRDIRVDEYLKNGISCVSAGYPFSDTLDIPSICKECEGVITFVRSKAKEWNIDPERIGVSGCSAGAIIAFWIGTHRCEQVSVIGATQQPIGMAALIPYITPTAPPCIIYQQDPESNLLHGPVNAQMIKDAYASNRGHDSLAAFAIHPDSGELNSLGQTPTEKVPRSFCLMPGDHFVVAAGQGSDRLHHAEHIQPR